AFAVNQKNGHLTKLNQEPSLGPAPCYVSIDQKNNVVLVANYMGGNVAANLLKPDGSLGITSSNGPHQGKGPKKQQDGPHAHCILPDPANKFALAVDLGIDQVLVYPLEADQKSLANPKVAYQTQKGA